MSCIISAYNKLNGTKTNTGRWYAGNTINSLMWGIGTDENTPPTLYSSSNFISGDIIGNSPYIFLDVSNVDAGEYNFEYRVTSGLDSTNSILTIKINNPPMSGDAVANIVLCANDDVEHNLFDEFLTGSKDDSGVWSGSGIESYGYKPYNSIVPTDDTFNPHMVGSTQTIDKTYEFRYTVSKFSKPACESCSSQTVVPVLVKVNCCTTSLDIASTNENCSYSANILNPNDYSNTAEIYLIDDSLSFGVRGRYVVTSSCEGVVKDQVVENITGGSCSIGQTLGGSVATQLLAGGKLLSVRMRSNSNPTLAVDLNLTDTAYLTGCGGTVSAGDLIYGSGTDLAFSNTIKTVITNAMCSVFSATPVTNFEITVITISGFMEIQTKIKHNASGLWCGMVGNDQRIVYQRDSNPANIFVANTVSGGNTSASSGVGVTGTYNLIGSCGTLIVSRSAIVSLDPVNSSYNLIYPNSYTSNWFSGSNNGPKTCITKNLTANASGCPGSYTYLWNTGETTQTIRVDDEGAYTVQSTCLTNNCTNTTSITI